MAATARKLCILLAAAACVTRADQAQDILRTVHQITTGLTDGNPSEAMDAFDKSTPGYETLQNEFAALTNAYQISNEVDVVDEDDSEGQSELTLRWMLTLTNVQTSGTQQKTAEVHARLRLEKNAWKVVEFSPVDFFTP